MGEAGGGARAGGAARLRGIGASPALQMAECTKPDLGDASRASDLKGGETEVPGGKGMCKGPQWSVLS